jgi:putative salt-induced outer membrane protein YdiY
MPTAFWPTPFLSLLVAVALSGPAGGEEPLIPPAPSPTLERLVLRHGETLTGRSLEIHDGILLWCYPDGTLLTIPLTDVERLEIGEQSDDPDETVPAISDPETVLGSEQTPLWTEYVPLAPQLQHSYTKAAETVATWTQRVQVGGQFNSGNTKTNLIDVAGVFERNTPEQMRQIDGGGQWGNNGSVQTANRWWLNSNFDWPIRDKWISFATSKNEYNGPAHLNYRGTLSGGLGYRFLFETNRRMIVRFGPAYTVEIFASPSRTRQTPDLFAEIETKWPVFERTSVEQKTRVQPSMLNAELVRVFSTTGVLVDLDEKARWKLRLGFQYQYNSQPNPGRVPSDYMTTLSLVYTRK